MTGPAEPDDRARRNERGLARYREVYGDDATVFAPGTADFFDLMIEQLFAEVWTRPALDIAPRRLLTMGVLAAQQHFDVLALQFERALATGELDVDQVREVVIHLVPYVGYPSSGALYGAGETAIAKHAARGVAPVEEAMTTGAGTGAGSAGRRRVAMIGLGRMGGPIADHVVRAGHEVRVHDVVEAAMAPRVALGATAAGSPAEAARGAEVVGVVVVDDAQALAVVDGPDGVLRTLAPGAVVAIHSTVTVDTVEELARRAEPLGVAVLDAGVSGGEAGAAAGTLVTMVGGAADAVERARPVFDAFSKLVVHAGPLGAGMALKLARNGAFYAAMAAIADAMVVAQAAGVDLALLRTVVDETNLLRDAIAPFSLGGPEPLPAGAPEAQRAAHEHVRRLGEKDLDQVLALAARLGVEVPAFDAARATIGRVSRV